MGLVKFAIQPLYLWKVLRLSWYVAANSLWEVALIQFNPHPNWFRNLNKQKTEAASTVLSATTSASSDGFYCWPCAHSFQAFVWADSTPWPCRNANQKQSIYLAFIWASLISSEKGAVSAKAQVRRGAAPRQGRGKEGREEGTRGQESEMGTLSLLPWEAVQHEFFCLFCLFVFLRWLSNNFNQQHLVSSEWVAVSKEKWFLKIGFLLKIVFHQIAA